MTPVYISAVGMGVSAGHKALTNYPTFFSLEARTGVDPVLHLADWIET